MTNERKNLNFCLFNVTVIQTLSILKEERRIWRKHSAHQSINFTSENDIIRPIRREIYIYIEYFCACNFCSSMYTCAYRASDTSVLLPPLRLQWSSPFKPAISPTLPPTTPFQRRIPTSISLDTAIPTTYVSVPVRDVERSYREYGWVDR